MQPRIWDEHGQGREKSEPLRGSRHPNKRKFGQREWADQSLPLDVYIAIHPVSSRLLSIE
jgi:hypothetical protein